MSMLLSKLPRGQRARISTIDADESLSRKLLEMGVLEGQELTLLHVGPIRRDPMAIRLNDRIIALRRRDASHIHVEPLH
jgi:ferrous iron transport protein A